MTSMCGSRVSHRLRPSGLPETNPVHIGLDSEIAPLRGSFQPDRQRFRPWGPGTVTIPADATPGRHVLVATRNFPT